MSPSTHPAPAAPELMWNERQSTGSGLVHRITIPVVARDLPGTLGHELTPVLSAWWEAPGALAPGATVTSVMADVHHDLLGDDTLQLIISTDFPVAESDLASMRMIRDLRRAMRNLRLTRFAAPAPELALAA